MTSTRAAHPSTHTATRWSRAPIVVVGACGGAGASSLAAALAVTSARGGPSALVDLDLVGGGLDVVLGIEGTPGARWTDLGAARGDIDPNELVASLPRWRRVPVLSADRRVPTWPLDDVAPDVLGALAARHRLVIDVPRERLARAGDGVTDALFGADARRTPGEPGAPHRADGLGRDDEPSGPGAVVLVVPLTISALAGAAAVRSSMGDRTGAGGLVVVTRTVRHSELRADDVVDALGIDVAARVGHDTGARGAIERGDGPRLGRRTGWRTAAKTVLDLTSGRASEAWVA